MTRPIHISGAFALLATSLILLLTSGCAATGRNHAEMEDELARIPPNRGRIVFYRDKSLLGAAMQPNIYVNGDLVGESKVGGFFYADLTPGGIEITARTEVKSTLAFELRDGQSIYVRSSIGMGLFIGRVQFVLIDPQEGRQALVGLSFTGAETKNAVVNASQPSQNSRSNTPVTLNDLDALLPKALTP